jgi:hypothetical protein
MTDLGEEERLRRLRNRRLNKSFEAVSGADDTFDLSLTVEPGSTTTQSIEGYVSCWRRLDRDQRYVGYRAVPCLVV